MKVAESSGGCVFEPVEEEMARMVVSKRKQDLGQFFTPEPIGNFMAGLFVGCGREVRVVDPGAGAGALIAAIVKRFCAERGRPLKITVTAYEIDKAILPSLRRTIRECEVASN